MSAYRERVLSLLDKVGADQETRGRVGGWLRELPPDSHVSLHRVLKEAADSSAGWTSEVVAFRVGQLEKLFHFLKQKGFHRDYPAVVLDLWSKRLQEKDELNPELLQRTFRTLQAHLKRSEKGDRPFRAAINIGMVHDLYRTFPRETLVALPYAGPRDSSLFPLHLYAVTLALKFAGEKSLRQELDKTKDPWKASSQALAGVAAGAQEESLEKMLRNLDRFRANLARLYGRGLDKAQG